MDSRLFLPTARQTNWLLLIGLLALGEALYLRYLAIEYAQVSLASISSRMATSSLPSSTSRP